MSPSSAVPNYHVALRRGGTTLELVTHLDERDRGDMYRLDELGDAARLRIRLQIRDVARSLYPTLGLRIVLWQQLELTPLGMSLSGVCSCPEACDPCKVDQHLFCNDTLCQVPDEAML